MTENQKEMFLRALAEFGSCNVRVSGSSMWPFICNGDVLCIKNRFKKPQLGMVVAFFNNNQLIVHRTLCYKKILDGVWKITLWGDSSPHSRSEILSNYIVGTLSHIQRKRKTIKLWFSPPVQILVLPLGFLLQLMVMILKKGRGLFSKMLIKNCHLD